MIHRLGVALGHIIWWAAWPLMWLCLRDSKRTRLLLVSERGEVLVVKGWITAGSKWNLPGGGLHRGEDPLAGVLRETREEVGIALVPNQVRPLGVGRFASKGFRFDLYFFTATITAPPVLKLQRHEIAEARWTDPTTLTPSAAGLDVVEALRLLARAG